MKYFTALILMVLTCSQSAYTQKSKFGKVTLEEIQEATHPIEGDAKAAVLYQEGIRKIEYNNSEEAFELVTHVYKKIKIYDDSESDLADINIPLYVNKKNKEKAINIKAIAYNIENGKIKKSALSNKNIYEEKSSKYWSAKKFAIPNVKKGTIIEYKYKIVSPFYYEIPTWYFQYVIPCNESYYELEIPEYYNYNTSSTGTIPLQLNEETTNRNITFTYVYDASQSELNVKRRRQTEVVKYLAHIKTFSAANTPSLKDESYVTNVKSYHSSVRLELYSTQFPRSPYKLYTQSWNKIGNTLFQSSDFGKELTNNFKPFKDLINKAKALEEPERLGLIYSTVQNEFTWNDLYNIASDKGIKKMLDDKIGSIAEINLLLINLLNKAGIPTVPIVTKSRNSGPLNTAYPTISDLNYVFGLATIGEKSYYVDATDKQILPGQLPLRAINIKGVLIGENKSQVISINNPNSYSETKMLHAKLDDELNFICEENIRLKNNAAISFRQKYFGQKSEDDYIETWEKENENIYFDSIHVENKFDRSQPIKIKKNYVLENGLEKIDAKLFINTLLGNSHSKNPFVSEDRQFPIFYPHRINEQTIITLQIPEGYVVESLPEQATISLPDKMGSFIFKPQVMNDKINITSIFKINQPTVNPDHYQAVKQFYDLMIQKQNEKIVLRQE